MRRRQKSKLERLEPDWGSTGIWVDPDGAAFGLKTMPEIEPDWEPETIPEESPERHTVPGPAEEPGTSPGTVPDLAPDVLPNWTPPESPNWIPEMVPELEPVRSEAQAEYRKPDTPLVDTEKRLAALKAQLEVALEADVQLVEPSAEAKKGEK